MMRMHEARPVHYPHLTHSESGQHEVNHGVDAFVSLSVFSFLGPRPAILLCSRGLSPQDHRELLGYFTEMSLRKLADGERKMNIFSSPKN